MSRTLWTGSHGRIRHTVPRHQCRLQSPSDLRATVTATATDVCCCSAGATIRRAASTSRSAPSILGDPSDRRAQQPSGPPCGGRKPRVATASGAVPHVDAVEGDDTGGVSDDMSPVADACRIRLGTAAARRRDLGRFARGLRRGAPARGFPVGIAPVRAPPVDRASGVADEDVPLDIPIDALLGHVAPAIDERRNPFRFGATTGGGRDARGARAFAPRRAKRGTGRDPRRRPA